MSASVDSAVVFMIVDGVYGATGSFKPSLLSTGDGALSRNIEKVLRFLLLTEELSYNHSFEDVGWYIRFYIKCCCIK